jgi:hypothetical protein
VFQDYGPFDSWPHAEGDLGLNPLYVEERRDGAGTVGLRRVFPGRGYEEEHGASRQYLPESISVSPGVLADLARGRRTPETEQLIGQIVALDIPKRYL